MRACMSHSAVILGPKDFQCCSTSIAVLAMGKKAKAKTSDKLAKAWEGARRIRKRFQRGGPWVVFPLPSSDRKKKDSENLHPVSTAALALNAETITSVVQLYGPNPVHVEPLQKQAWGWLGILQFLL